MPPRSKRPDPHGGEFIPVARILKAHGLRGEVSVELYTDFPERMTGRGVQLELAGDRRRAVVLQIRGVSGSRAILELEGVTDRESARHLQGALLTVRRDQVPPLPEGEYYDFQIVGLRVFTTDGRDLGVVTEILRTGANDVYLTDRVPIPAVDRFIRSIDLAAGRMVVEGIDELL
ncbi:MAG: 16S rRNA processing protein RimM [Armatimonadetes bacterium]|nr:16S rRNA processing protein RimM [Armatimonadota bacterium]